MNKLKILTALGFLFLSFNTLSFAALQLNDITLSPINYTGTKQEALSAVFELFGYTFEPGTNTTSINGYNNLLTNLPNADWVLIKHDFTATSSNYAAIFSIYLGYSEDFTEYTAFYTYGYLPGPRPVIAFQSQGTSYNLRVSVSSSYNDYVLYYKNGEYLEYGSNTIFDPNIEFIPNGDELSYYTNGFKVNNLTVYYDMASWVNLGTLVNATDFDIVASLGRISDPSSDYHLYETFSYPEILRIIDKTYVDINSYYLKSGNFYVLTFAFYNNNEYITEITTYYYINGGPSSGDWLVVRSGDTLNSPDSQTNTLNIINAINDTIGTPPSGDEEGTGVIGAIYDVVGTPPSGDDEGTGIIGGILSGIKRLFVPDQQQFRQWILDTQADVDNHSGIFAKPSGFFKSLLGKVYESGDFIIEIPDIIVPAGLSNNADPNAQDLVFYEGDGQNNVINFTELVSNEPWKTIYDYFITLMSGIFIIAFLSYLWSFYEHILGSRDVEGAYQILDKNGPQDPVYLNSTNEAAGKVSFYKNRWTGRRSR